MPQQFVQGPAMVADKGSHGRHADDQDGDGASAREWKHLDENLKAKNLYIIELERTLRAKNNHIATLERLVKKHQAAMSPLPVRVALRLTRRR
jgi:hypothetical protein